jgi:hypothetical protein
VSGGYRAKEKAVMIMNSADVRDNAPFSVYRRPAAHV